MGFPWFASRKNRPAESQGFNIFFFEISTEKINVEMDNFWSLVPEKKRKPGEKPSLASVVELESVLNKFDGKGDGKISLSGLGHVMRSLGHKISEDELRMMMIEADSDGDGHVDLAEFAALNTRDVDSTARLQDLQEAFKMFDMNGDGSISVHELDSVLRRLGEISSLDDCHSMIARVDADWMLTGMARLTLMSS